MKPLLKHWGTSAIRGLQTFLFAWTVISIAGICMAIFFKPVWLLIVWLWNLYGN